VSSNSNFSFAFLSTFVLWKLGKFSLQQQSKERGSFRVLIEFSWESWEEFLEQGTRTRLGFERKFCHLCEKQIYKLKVSYCEFLSFVLIESSCISEVADY